MTQRSSEVASKKSLSCETIKETPLKSASIVLIASLEVKSRWLVGSSITTISGWARSIFAKATLDLSPPERVQIFLICFFWINEQSPEKSHCLLKRNSRSNQLFSNRCLKIQILSHLGIKSNPDFFMDSHIAIQRFELTKQGFEQSRLPYSVFSDDSDFHRFGNFQFTRQID